MWTEEPAGERRLHEGHSTEKCGRSGESSRRVHSGPGSDHLAQGHARGFGEGFAPTASIRAPESPSSSEASGFPRQPVSRADLRSWSLQPLPKLLGWRPGRCRGPPESPRSGGGAVGLAEGGTDETGSPGVRGPEGGPRRLPVFSCLTAASAGCAFSCLQTALNHTFRHRAGMRLTRLFARAKN
jgi:hypothetical protein